MSSKIKFRRSTKSYSSLVDEQVKFGEPIFIDGTNGVAASELNDSDTYLVLGRKYNNEGDIDATLDTCPVIKAYSKDKADRALFISHNSEVVDGYGNIIPVDDVNVRELSSIDLDHTDATKYHILVQAEGSNKVSKFALDGRGIYITANGVMCGAAWNDYAENRKIIGPVKPGQVVCDFEDGVVVSDERLQPCAYVVSDTYGYTMGADEPFTVPVAVAGRVLVYIKEKNPKVGDCVCADKDGLASVMTREEVINYPDRILGVVSEIPRYATWKDIVPVDGRVWIKLR